MRMTRKTAQTLLAAIVLASILFSSFTLAQQTKCGNRVCDAGELDSCKQDCGAAEGQLGAGNTQKTGNAPPNGLSLPIAFGVILVVLLVITGYAMSAKGGPTPYWKKRHASKRRKK